MAQSDCSLQGLGSAVANGSAGIVLERITLPRASNTEGVSLHCAIAGAAALCRSGHEAKEILSESQEAAA